MADAPESLYDIDLADGEKLTIDVVNMGNPHAVTIVPDVITADVARIGAGRVPCAFPGTGQCRIYADY